MRQITSKSSLNCRDGKSGMRNHLTDMPQRLEQLLVPCFANHVQVKSIESKAFSKVRHSSQAGPNPCS